jgi:5'-3' exonuclease
MYVPKGNGEMITFNSFVKEWGIYPEDWAYVKAIAGCSSDNVQGVYGVGDPTAAKYLSKKMKVTSKKYQDIERALIDGLLSINLPLVRLPFEGIEIKDCLYRPNKLDYNAFLDICEQYHFLSFLDKNNSDFHEWKDFFKGFC